MIPAIGHLSLILAFLMALALGLLPLIHRFSTYRQSLYYGMMVAMVQMAAITASFGSLIYSHAVSDFSVLNVVTNSHSAKPLLYKISGVWGNHEGSMLLWGWMLVAFTFLFTFLSRADSLLKTGVLAMQGLLSAGFLAFILYTSNPFIRVFPRAAEGQGFNPLLQDIGLAIHPPCLYVGYVGFSLSFSAAITVLAIGKAGSDWAARIKPWVLVSWSFLTLGIALGSWWAYRELGWGGFWFWDPVENASLMPWLLGTALLHSLIVVEKRQQLHSWTLLLALFTFALSLLGTFLVRSGILTSVHSFANDPERGFFILALLSIVTCFSLLLFACRAHRLVLPGSFSPVSRESALLFNNLFLVTACSTILLGTLYPIFYELLSDGKLSIGTPYFSAVFIPIMLPLLGLAAVGSLLKWKQDRLRTNLRKHLLPVSAGIATALFGWWQLPGCSLQGLVALWLGGWLIAAMLREWGLRVKLVGRVPTSFYAMALAHIGAGMLAIGVTVAVTGFQEKQQMMKPGDKLEMAGYVITFQGVTYQQGPNYLIRKGKLYVETTSGNEITTLYPEVRFYPVEKSQTTESAVHTRLAGDLYAAMGDMEGEENAAIRLYFRPFILWIWSGAGLMALGGIVALFRRRKS